jgi:hypothetical protein
MAWEKVNIRLWTLQLLLFPLKKGNEDRHVEVRVPEEISGRHRRGMRRCRFVV